MITLNLELPSNVFLSIIVWQNFYRDNTWEELTFNWSYE